jgi:hypothetical protein
MLVHSTACREWMGHIMGVVPGSLGRPAECGVLAPRRRGQPTGPVRARLWLSVQLARSYSGRTESVASARSQARGVVQHLVPQC